MKQRHHWIWSSFRICALLYSPGHQATASTDSNHPAHDHCAGIGGHSHALDVDKTTSTINR